MVNRAILSIVSEAAAYSYYLFPSAREIDCRKLQPAINPSREKLRPPERLISDTSRGTSWMELPGWDDGWGDGE